MFGDVLRKLRIEKGLSQRDLSQASGLDKGHISRLENGERCPTYQIVSALAYGLRLRGEERRLFYHAAGFVTPEEQHDAIRRLLVQSSVTGKEVLIAV